MTENKANKVLKSLEIPIFYNNIFGDVRYAAVIKNPDKLKDYVIELGIKGSPFKLILKNIGNNFDLKSLEQVYDNFNTYRNNLKDNGVASVQNTDEIVLLECGDTSNKSVTKQEKIEGGISISSEENLGMSGTLGAVFSVENNSNIYAITNEHVLDKGSLKPPKNNVVHPGTLDSLEKDRVKIGIINYRNYAPYVDLGIIELTEKYPIGDSLRCKGIRIKGIGVPKIGDKVKKCGRTTSLTYGEIISINCTLFESTRDKIFKKQLMLSCMAEDGDSGSVLINENNEAVGLIFAKNKNQKYTYANNIEYIFGKYQNKIKFKEFINNQIFNIMEIPVLYGDDKNPYELYEKQGTKLEAIFIEWEKPDKKRAIKLRLINTLENEKILRVDYIKNGDCNELQIKTYKDTTTSTYEQTIDACDFNSTQVQIIQFTDCEIEHKLHLEKVCADQYQKIIGDKCEDKEVQFANGPIPEVRKGNILQGGN